VEGTSRSIPGRLPASVGSLRSTQPGQFGTRGAPAAIIEPSPSRTKPGSGALSPSSRTPFSSSRYNDGRNSVYRAPDWHAYSSRNEPYYRYGRNDHDRHDVGPHHGPSDHDGRDRHYPPYRYDSHHHAYAPFWYGPAVYPVSGFAFSWSSGACGFSVATYCPTYSHYRYYDSWSCGGWGYSNLYYGGWRHGWYGGVSYIYNPWPVYRSYYLYDPEPLVIPSETVYVTQPATTTYVAESPAATTYAAPDSSAATTYAAQPATTTYAAQPATTTYAAQPTTTPQILPQQATPAVEPAAAAAAPAMPAAETAIAEPCNCPCHCNRQRPCTCSYPCGSEYAVVPEAFDLNANYASYADSLDPETIWSSYAGLDRWDADTGATRLGTPLSADNAGSQKTP